MKPILFTLCLLAFSLFAIEPFQLTLDGNPRAVIGIPADASTCTEFAAEELQKYVKDISGATLPILSEEEAFQSGQPVVLLGSTAESERLSQSSNTWGDDVLIGSTDGFAARRVDDNLYIYGKLGKGALNGVYDVLYRNTDLIFARPNLEFGTIYSENSSIVLHNLDFISVPAFARRGIFINSTSNWEQEQPNEIYLVHNQCNICSGYTMPSRTSPGDPGLRKKHGLNLAVSEGHNICAYIPEDVYFKDHPEYYVFRDGERRPPSYGGTLKTQACFTNPEMCDVFCENFMKMVREHQDYDMFDIMIEDNYLLCECEECLKPIALPDGTQLTSSDPAFRSTQFFMFLNKIARKFAEEFPDKRIHTYAYFFTITPPKIDVEKNILIQYCPLGTQNMKPIFTSANQMFYKPLLSWMERGIGLRWREYYPLAMEYPRPMADRVAADYQFLKNYGNVEFYIETPPDDLCTWYSDPRDNWNASSMEIWLMIRLAWNPYLDVQAERKEYIRRVYGPAAPIMERYYELLRNNFSNAPNGSHWYHNARLYWAGAIYYQGLEDTCRNMLDQAAALITNPASAKFLEANRQVFEHCMKLAKLGDITASRTTSSPKFTTDFTQAPWDETQCVSDAFLKIRSPLISENRYVNKPDQQTEVRLLYDDAALYVGIFCQDNAPDTLYEQISQSDSKKEIPEGDNFQIYIAHPQTRANDSALFQFNFNGKKYERLLSNAYWNGKWDVETKVTENGWVALVTIPWSTLDMTLQDAINNPLKLNLYRQISHHAPRTTNVSLTGATIWSVLEYGRLTLTE